MREAIIYQYQNFLGRHHHIYQTDDPGAFGDDSNLKFSNMNDLTSSIVIKSGQWSFYQHADFEGSEWILNPGLYKNKDVDPGFGDSPTKGIISSVKSTGAETATSLNGEIILFEHSNFTGQHHHVFTYDQEIKTTFLDGKISSAVVISGDWEFYEKPNFEGIKYDQQLGTTLPEPNGMYGDIGEFTIGAFLSLDEITGVPGELTAPNEIILFEHPNFRGKHHHIYSQDHDLSRTGMDNNVSSVVVISGVWEFFASKNFKGKRYEKLEIGLYEDVEKNEILHDVISSVKLVPEIVQEIAPE